MDNGFQSENPDTLDRTRAHLALWLARHLHVPQLLAWVLRNGGHLHPGLRQEVQRSLADKDLDIPHRLRLLWTVLLDNKPTHPWRHLWTSDRYLAAASDSERRSIEDEVIESISPRASSFVRDPLQGWRSDNTLRRNPLRYDRSMRAVISSWYRVRTILGIWSRRY